MGLLNQIISERGVHDANLGERLMMFIKQRGFTLIGSGTYARVYGSAHAPYVIKIFRKDPCYSKFLSLAAKTQNSHFPRLVGEPRRISAQDIMIKMEKLKKASPRNTFLVKRISQGFTQIYGMRVHGQDNSGLDAKLSAWLKGIEQHAELIEAVKLLHDTFGKDGCYLDLDTSNIMQRADGTVVIIDPVTGKL